MLTSLFGALYPRRADAGVRTDQDFSPTLILESRAGSPDQGAPGHPAPPSRDLLIHDKSGGELCRQLLSPAPDPRARQALRHITLFDPGRLCASTLIKCLSEASGEPLERVYLRRQDTLSTVALVERTALPRRLAEPLQVSQVEVRSHNLRDAGAPLALLGHSHLAVVMLAPMAAPVLDQLLVLLQALVRRPDWRCPHLLLIGQADSLVARRLATVRWPAHLNAEICLEALPCASSTWNAILRHWNRMKLLPQKVASLPSASPGPVPAAGMAALRPRTAAQPAAASRGGTALRIAALCRPPLDRLAMLRTLQTLAAVGGVLGAAVVDSTTGLVLGRRSAVLSGAPDLDQAALMLSEVLKAHRRLTFGSGCSHVIEEVLVTQPSELQVLRTLSTQPRLFLLAVLDRTSSNLGTARRAVTLAEKNLH